MKTPESLKTELFQKLKQCPAIEAFFKDSLQKRVRLDDKWIENTLVAYILDQIPGERDKLTEWIEVIAKDRSSYDVLHAKVSGNRDYDQKLQDVFVELGAYVRLKRSGFTEIQAIPENSQQKTPDFSANLNNDGYLFEVKNMRSPTDLEDTLHDKIRARRLLAPDIYKALTFNIRLSRAWEDVAFKGDRNCDLRVDVHEWLANLFCLIEKGENLKAISSRPFMNRRKGELTIECDLKKGEHFVITGFSRGRLLDIDRMRELPRFLRKAVNTVTRGIPQLLEYDEDNQYRKYIVLGFEVSRARVLMQEELSTIVKGMDNIVKSINSNLYVRSLEEDKYNASPPP